MDDEERSLLEGEDDNGTDNWNFLYRPNVIFVSIYLFIYFIICMMYIGRMKFIPVIIILNIHDIVMER